MLTVSHVSKRFKDIAAVQDVSFEIRKGEIFGLLGPNGAGKTTTLNMICSLIKPDSGRIELDGMEVTDKNPGLRKKLGVVPQDVALYEEFSAVDNLKFWGGLYGLKGTPLKSRIAEVLSLVGLEERSRDRMKTYSGGMKRRLNLACGMIHNPGLLLLDEPTVGIDPQGRHAMLDMIRRAAKSGTTILYTTHYLDEAESLCDRLCIMDHGRVLATGNQDEIKRIVGENRIFKVTGVFEARNAEEMPGRIPELTLLSLRPNEVLYSLPVRQQTGKLIETLIASGFQIENLSIKEPSLDSVFLKLTGKELRD
ncbi:ABC transporter ATP-binding protein [bacterium]|nr:ABC transporter ATP-binding protein [bacterium]